MKLITGNGLALAIVIWPAIFVTTTFVLFYSCNSRYASEQDAEAPTISETGFISPAGVVFTYGLHLEAFLLCFLFLKIYTVYDQRINELIRVSPLSTEEQAQVDSVSSLTGYLYCCCNCFTEESSIKRQYNIQLMPMWNRVCIVLGLCCCLFMSFVGSVTLGVNRRVHTAFALVLFFFGILHMLLFYTKIAWYLETNRYRLFVYQAVLAVCVPFNVLIAIIAGSMASCSSQSCLNFTDNILSFAEYWTSCALLAYCYSFRADIVCITLTNVLNEPVVFNNINNNDNSSLASQSVMHSKRKVTDESVMAAHNSTMTQQLVRTNCHYY